MRSGQPQRAAWRIAIALASTAILAAGATAGCRSLSSSTPRAPRRAILISIDGASATELDRLHREGAFPPGGFERFFAEGEIAAGLVEVDPTVTAASHIAIITGQPPAITGIVNNDLRLPGADLLRMTSGFAAPIEAETLWEAARRQHRRVGVLTWPGADDRSARRAGDWGLVYGAPMSVAPAIETLSPPSPQPPGGETASSTELQLAGGSGPPLDLAVSISPPRDQQGTTLHLEPRDGAPVDVPPGAWREIRRGDDAGWVKALDTAGSGEPRIFLAGLYRTVAYPPSFAARLTEAGVRWPGEPDDHAVPRSREQEESSPGIDLETWIEQVERFADFFGAALRRGLADEPWDLALAYFPVVDEAGHLLLLTDPRQTGYTPERAAAFAGARRRAWLAVDRELARTLAAVDLRHTSVFVVSDHGMVPVHRMIHPNLLLARAGYLHVDGGKPDSQSLRAWCWTSNSVAHVYVNLAGREPHGVVPPADLASTVASLRQLLLAARDGDGQPLFQRVLDRHDLRSLGMDHPRGGDLVAWASKGYAVSAAVDASAPIVPSSRLGNHGYPATDPDMRGIFLALGAGIPPGRLPLVRSLEVAGRVSASMGIAPPSGRIETAKEGLVPR